MIQCNYTQIPNDFLDNLHLYSESATKVFLAICRKTIGWHKLCDRISYSQLQEITGLSTNSLRNGITELIKANLITRESTKYGYKYDLNIIHKQKEVSDFDTTEENTLSKSDTKVSKSDIVNQKLISKYDIRVSKFDSTKETNIKEINKKTNIKENYSPSFPFKNLLEYFISKTDKGIITFSHTVLCNIQKWADAGYTLDDFKRVIDIKTKQWLSDPKANAWLKPSTLFGDKFCEYVTEKTPEEIEQAQRDRERQQAEREIQARLIKKREQEEQASSARELARREEQNREKAREIESAEVDKMLQDPKFLTNMYQNLIKAKRF